MKKQDWHFERRFEELGVLVKGDVEQKISDLTYGECEEFAAELANAADPQEVVTALNNRWNDCTLQTRVSPEDETTWRDRCTAETHFNR
jgi:hypothetical protein